MAMGVKMCVLKRLSAFVRLVRGYCAPEVTTLRRFTNMLIIIIIITIITNLQTEMSLEIRQ